MHGSTELQIDRWGNSFAIRLPANILSLLNLTSEGRISCAVENDKLILEPARQPKYTLEALLSEVEEPGEEISWGKPEGDEVW